MGQRYLSLTIDLPEAEAEAVEDLLHSREALGLEVRDREAPPMPGVRGPKPGEAIVVAFFDDEAHAREVEAEVRAEHPAATALLEEVIQQDWSNAWKARIRSVEVGRLWVGPPWDLAGAPASKVRLVIEPKMAFGTGDHPTTSLCLAAVDEAMAELPGASVLDVGTGTGVLAIAARKLGASRVVGVDNDAISVELARENAQVNGTPEIELSQRSLDQIEGRFDLVLANILANTLVELAPLIAPKVGRRLVLAGVLVHQKDEVAQAYLDQGLSLRGTTVQGEWIRIDLEKRG